jgi:hypothetical protein
MAKTWDEFTSRFLSEVPRCSQPLAEQKVLDAAIEFCRRTHILKVQHTPISAVAAQREYDWAPGSNLKVVRPEQVFYNGVQIDPATEDDLAALYTNWNTETGTPKFYLQQVLEKLILCPIPDEDLADAITALVSVRPSLDATDIDDAIFDKYVEEIAWGAKARLFAMPNTDWFSPDGAAYNKRLFESCIARVAVLVDKGHTRAPLRSRTVDRIE